MASLVAALTACAAGGPHGHLLRSLPLAACRLSPPLLSDGSERAQHDWAGQTVKALQRELRSRGLKVSGRKAELVRRLEEASPARLEPGQDGPVQPPPLSSSQLPRPVEISPDVKSVSRTQSSTGAVPGRVQRSHTPRQSALDPSAALWRVASWNVAGLRGLLKKSEGVDALRHLVQEEHVAVILLQETKLQTQHVPEVEEELLNLLASLSRPKGSSLWRAKWSCSTGRKGYSGVATLWCEIALGIDVADQDMPAQAASGTGHAEHTESNGSGSLVTCAPLAVDAGHEAGSEGRGLCLRLPLPPPHPPESPTNGISKREDAHELVLVNVYTPNSGAGLVRLDYRVGPGGWDERFLESLRREYCAAASYGATPHGSTQPRIAAATANKDTLEMEGYMCGQPCGNNSPRRALIAAGDYNVAVYDLDIWNAGEPRIEKQAGTTPDERASMLRTIDVFRDAFRLVHPSAEGQFTFWSQRARARPRNRGLRLDYFLVCDAVAHGPGALVDVQHLHELEGSDHCPILLTLDARALAASLAPPLNRARVTSG